MVHSDDEMEPAIPRIRLRTIFVIMAITCVIMFLGGPLAIAVIALIFAPAEVSIPIASGAVVFVLGLGYAMSSSYQWVELDDGVIRGRKLLTRKIVEKPVAEIIGVASLNSKGMGPLENLVLDAFMKTSNRGYQLRFRDGTKLALVRGDMAGLDEFLIALADQMKNDRRD
ncbi:hypothetical protein [Zavarzinella formosa]|uniref:hypothetical protein n=1 Tax=Zavarzinella formosa TaxID=360055 RepID=UPI0002F90806|nr:hypothetical protein [Zavarzinella formosa]